MHVIVVGCGRVGSTVARELISNGHTVCVIDRRPDAFRRLGADFAGRTLAGIGFDRAVLTEAGITEQCAVMAVTSGDNSNVLIARVARETFGVERVVARIYDPKRAAIYARLGIPTVASVSWTSARALQLILPEAHTAAWTDPTARFALVERKVPAKAAGRPLAAFEAHGLRVVLITRNGEARLPEASMLLQQDDLIHVVVAANHLESVDAALQPEGTH